MKKIIAVFLFAFFLNLIWENFHSYLYDNYQGGEITQFILARASLFDALVIMVFLLPFLYFSFFRKRIWLIIVIGIIIAIFNEWYGLGTGRWAYNSSMPILPLVEVGLTPVLQLGFLGYLSYKFQEYITS